MRKKFFRTDNFHRLETAVKSLKEADASLPRIGVVFSRPGFGKTESVEYLYSQGGILYVRLRRVWSVRDLLGAILEELFRSPEHRTSDRFDQCAKELGRSGEPLFVDEGDYAFRNSALLDLLRDLHDIARVPVILIGMENMAARLERFAQFWSRVLPAGIVEFKPLSAPELILITKEWCELDLVPEAADIICKFSEGDFRLFVGYLVELERACKLNKTNEIARPMVEALFKKLERKREIADRFRDVKRLQVVGREAI